ncbi:hypothetical protein ACQKWADRAFT_279049 [Trichoderma austrokoningii]
MQTSLLGTSIPVVIGVFSDMPCSRFPNRGCRLRFDTCGGEEIRPLREPCFLQREGGPLRLQNYPGNRAIRLHSADTAVVFVFFPICC